MIVKNEKEVITRCLESVLPLIDTWVIVDTGSTDGTQTIIKEFMQRKRIPGELHERPWVNFGHNRQEALVFAKGKADYILFMDADDKLVFADNFKMPELTKDFYAILSSCSGIEYWFQRIVKADLDWYWDGVVHENLYSINPLEGATLEGITYLYIHDGARAKDPMTAQKDILLLEESIQKNPENARDVFNLARTYAKANLTEKALECFKKRLQLKGTEQEVFISHMMIGHLQNALHFDASIVEESYFKAYLSRPHRAEPLYHLAHKLCERNEFEKSYKILHLALELPSSTTDYMYSEKWIYDYGILLQLLICAKHTERLREGIELCEKLFKLPNLPSEARIEVEQLFESLHQMNVKQVEQKLRKIVGEKL